MIKTENDFFSTDSNGYSRTEMRRQDRMGGHRVRNTVLACLSVIVAGSLIAGLIVMLARSRGGPKVPDVIGSTYDEAQEKAESADLTIDIDPMQDTSSEYGGLIVEEQDPKPGTKAYEGSVIIVRLKGLRDSPMYIIDQENGATEPYESEQELPGEGDVQPAPAETAINPAVPTGRSVCIDPGHSVNSPGSEMDPATGLNVADNGGAAGELQAMWELAQKVKARLETAGYTVRLTKESQNSYASLRTRADVGNTCQIMVRLHYDTNLHAILYPGEGQFKQNGGNVVYVDANVAGASAQLAQAMFPSLQNVGVTGIRNDCGGTSDNTGSAFVGSVLSRVPVVLIENDPAMVRNNPGGQDRVADAILGGVNTYFQTR